MVARVGGSPYLIIGDDFVCFQVASCDADGVVKMWDARMVAEIGTMEAGQHPLNSLCLDRSATRLAAASNDGTVKVRWGGSMLLTNIHAYFV